MIGKLDKVRGAAVAGGPLRSVGRIALWAVILLLLFRGVVSTASPRTEPTVQRDTSREDGSGSDLTSGFAVRFVRSYLTGANVNQLLAPGAAVGGTSPFGEALVGAESIFTRALGGGRSIVTVAVERANGDVLHLAVPIVRDMAGGVAATGAPAFVSAPGIGRVESEPERSQPILGADAEDLRELARRFVDTYLTSTNPGDLSYLTTADAGIQPLGGVTPLGAASVKQLGDGEGPKRVLVATVSVRIGAAVYPVTYRLGAVRLDRWYVSAVEGEVR